MGYCKGHQINYKSNVAMLVHDVLWNVLHVYFYMFLWGLHHFSFRDPIFGPKMSSALRMSCLVTGQFSIRFLSTYFIRSWVEGLPMMFWSSSAFLAFEYYLTVYLLNLCSTVVTRTTSLLHLSKIALYLRD